MAHKTGIITFQNANNYGAVLQAFALQKVMEELGSEVNIINYNSPNMGLKSLQKDYFKDFISEYLNLTEEYNSINNIEAQGYDLLITGSDQVWNPQLTGCDPAYFLSFAKEKTKTAAYAASIGIEGNELEPYRSFFEENLQKIMSVSIREESQKQFIQEIINDNVNVNVDPTLLLSADQYLGYLGIERKNREYIFMYSNNADAKLLDFVNLLSLYTEMPVVAVTRLDEMLFVDGSTVYRQVPPKEWLSAIASSSIVITDSFHGLMFSLIFEKPFYIYTKKRNNISRITGILEQCDLFDRRLTKLGSVDEVEYNIDFSKAREVIQDGKQKAVMYLKGIY